MMDRISVCQALLDARGGGNYLEIGINTGCSFIPVRARVKWGVDPAYVLSWKRLLKYRIFAALGWKEERVFRMTSDAFFDRYAGMLHRRGIDVAFVDGLHTYEQALRDVENTLAYLKPGGVIVMHDCNPQSEIAAMPARSIAEVLKSTPPGWNGIWNGDVWKTVVYLRAFRNDLRTIVLDCDQGLGVVLREPIEGCVSVTQDELERMNYADLNARRNELLGLRPMDALNVLLQ